MRRLLSALGLGTVLLASASPAMAATLQAGESLSVSVPFADDLYVAGGTVEVREAVNGDLIIAGGQLVVSGRIAGDVLAGGGDVSVRGEVGDDVRVGGGQVDVRGHVRGDLVVAGGQVTLERGAVVDGDVVLAGGMLTVDGTARRSLRAVGGMLLLRGSVEGGANLRVDEVQLGGVINGDVVLAAEKFTASPEGRINGRLEYWLPGGQQTFEGVVTGEAVYNPELRRTTGDDIERGFAGAFAAAALGFEIFSFLAATLIILLLLLATRTYFSDAALELHAHPGRSAWRGFLFFALTPIIAILCFLSLVGIPIGIFVVVYYVLVILLAKVIMALVLARWIELQWKFHWSRWMTFLWTLLTYLGLKILGWIPVLGWLVCMALAFLAFGALMTVKYHRYLKVR